MMPDWSSNQLNAITAKGGSIIVSAAAGSGKTAVLVERVIRMITDEKDGVSADRLLVVTYTRKAAAELKGRLEDALNKRISQEPDNRFLLRQRSLISKAQISTIDSFCMSLCREYFYLLDIDRRTRIADEGEQKVLRSDAMRMTLDALYTEGSERFHKLVETFATARDDSRLADNIQKLYDFLQSHPFPKRWMAEKLAYYTDFSDVCDSVWGRIVGDYTDEALDYIEKLCERGASAVALEEKLIAKLTPLFEGYFTFLDRLKDARSKGWNAIRDVLGSFDKGSFSTPRGYKDHPLKIAAASARDVFVDTVKHLDGLYVQDDAMCVYDIELLKDYAEELFRAVILFGDSYSALKRDRAVADYNDLEHWALELLIDPETGQRTPIADEAAGRYDCIMVDEYQDANEVQDTIFKTISRGEKNLFVVGDVKQSIYGFRQAMPELFLQRKNNSVLYDADDPVFPAKIILEKNFRSDKAVLAAVNFFFSKLMSPSVGDIEYNEEERLYDAAKFDPQPEPAVEFDMIDLEGVEETDAAVAEARFIAERIHEIISGGYQVKDRENGVEYYRPAAYGDFAVLMRNLKSYGAVYREVLDGYGIIAHTDSTMGFLGAREVMLMTNFLRVINNPALDIELLSVLMSPVFAFDEDDLARIRTQSRRSSLYAAVTIDAEQGGKKSMFFLRELAYYRELSASVPMYKLITVIYERSSFMSIVSASDCTDAASGNLRLLLDYARSFELNTRRGLSSFVGYLDRLIEDGSDLPAAVSERGADTGVELLTVHSSKGLEFPVCFIANTARKFVTDSTEPVLLHSHLGYAQKRFDPVLRVSYETLPHSALAMEIKRDEMSEELRILYVAMTRAKQKLIMVCTPRSGARKYIESVSKKLAGQREISPFAVRSANTLGDWITMCALLHPDGRALRKYSGVETDFEPENEFSFNCRVIDTPFGEKGESGMKTDPKILAASPIADEVRKHASFVYPYEGLNGVPAKVAASYIAHRNAEKAPDHTLTRPAFMEHEKLTAAQKGTALHMFMQQADFKAAREDINAELSRLTESGYLTAEQADSIDIERARDFINSPLVTRCLNSRQVYKEYRFNVRIPAYIADPDVDERFRDELIILQGAVDLAFVEDGELVIVDYKTDNIKKPETLVERYAIQLKLYGNALEQCLGLPVRELLIYSIRLGAEIKV